MTPAATRPLFDDVELLRRLVAFDSTSRNPNRPIAEFVADYLDRPGIRIVEDPSDGDPGKVNLIVHVGPGLDPEGDNGRDGLTLCGHLDVVPADEPEWTSDPFELIDAGDRLVGRGACDMKGFDALAINTLARVDPATLTRPLALVLTYDEEIGTIGAHDLVRRHHATGRPALEQVPRRMIVGEPTSLQAVRLHKGHARQRLVVHGTPAHSGYPHLGHNALEPMGRVLVALAALRRELEAERSEQSRHFPEVPWVALNVAMLHAGTAINIVPDRAELELGFRVLPGLDAKAVAARIRAAVAAVLDGERWELSEPTQSPPMLLDESSDLYLEACALVDQDATVAASYATDAGWLQQAGFDCLLLGPGDIGVAHKPNEWVPKTDLARCATLLDHLVDRFCRP
ncbi:MAG: acetylornithine deacetylase [Acidobacteriota bacterium]